MDNYTRLKDATTEELLAELKKRRELSCMVVDMKWNAMHQKYLMNIVNIGADMGLGEDFFIFDFWNCPTLKKVFVNLDKVIISRYEMILRPIKPESLEKSLEGLEELGRYVDDRYEEQKRR